MIEMLSTIRLTEMSYYRNVHKLSTWGVYEKQFDNKTKTNKDFTHDLYVVTNL